MKKTRFVFQKEKYRAEVLKAAVKEQTRRLIDYAEVEIEKIADDITANETENNMDRTGNLLDSLCYAVYYNGGAKKMGYYRKSVAIENSNLHEYSTPKGESVNGHALAAQFLASHKPRKTGWEIFFAVLAPYWGYWEKGFTHPNGLFYHWFVMTRHYDNIKSELAPMKVKFDLYIPSY